MPRTKNNPQLFIGIDNGVSGSIGGIYRGQTDSTNQFVKTPVIMQQDYTKKKKRINRIDTLALDQILDEWMGTIAVGSIFVMMERPMINPQRFNASCSALRALEATLIVLEDLGLPIVYVDSREWQKPLLPKGVSGPDLKKASREIATRLFPEFREQFDKHKDADGMLIAEHCRRKFS